MKRVSFAFIYILIFSSSCNHNGKQRANTNHDDSWSSLIIISDNYEVIAIDNNDDTTNVKTYDSGSFFSGYHKAKVDSVRAFFSKTEKDSLFLLTRDIISNPVKLKAACTDFVGELKLTIVYGGRFGEPGSYKQSIEYSGVCEWDTLSQETIQLNNILRRKIKWKNK